MDVPLLEELQSKFKCTQCGKCCAVGGDMLLSEGDVVRLVLDLDYGIMGFINQFLVVVPGEPVQYRIKDTAPCVFLDKLSRQCQVHSCWPKACLDYPFRLYLQGGCHFEDVLVCPVAVKMLEDHLKGAE
jgi:Fe-S-cluster containining protein